MHPQEKRMSPATALLLCGSALYLCVNLFASVRVPFLIGGDQAYFWMRAMRMLEGQRVYQNFSQYTPPGADLLFYSLFKQIGVRMWVANVVVLMLGLAFVWLIFSIARRFARSEAALLAAGVFVVGIYGKALTATHHWFGTLAALLAVRLMIEARTATRIACAGAILAVGSFFSLYHGFVALLAFSIFLLWSDRREPLRWAALRRQALLFGSYAVALALLYSHYLFVDGISRLWYFQVTYVREFAVDAYRGGREMFGVPLTLRNLPAVSDFLIVYVLLIAAIGGALALCWRHRRTQSDVERGMLVVLVAMFLLGEVSASPSWLRIYAVAAPAVILLGWVVDRLPRLRFCVSIALWSWIAILGVHQTVVHRKMQRAVIDLPAGRVATTPQMAAKLTMVSRFAKPDDTLFQAAWPGLYVPLHLRNPIYFETVGVSDMPLPRDVTAAVEQLNDERVTFVLWGRQLDSSCNVPCNDRLTPMRDYVHAAYAPVATLPDGDTLWRRRE